MLTKPNTLRLVFFLAAFAGALYYPVREVLAFERPKVPPAEMRFKVRGYDPYDPMRGHYLQLQVQSVIKMPPRKVKKLSRLFRNGRAEFAAVLKTKKDGFAEAVALYPLRRMPEGKTFVKVARVSFFDREKDSHCTVFLPFDKYFINEKLAKDAEGLLQNVTRDKNHSAVLVVNVYADGRYAVKELLVDDKPVLSLLRPEPKR